MTTHLTTLPNRLRVATAEMPQAESVSIAIGAGVGSRAESPELGGMSHFLEHMMFKGTSKRNAQQIAEEFDAIGGHLNAFTSRELTVYYAKVLPEYVETAFEILADMVTDSIMDEVELAREQGVVIQEIAQSEDTPDDIIFDHYQGQAFPEGPLGRPILGTVESVSSFDSPKVLDYMARYYHPGNLVVGVAGNIDAAQVNALAERYLGELTPRETPPQPQASYQGGQSYVKRDLEQLHVILGLQGLSHQAEDFYRLQVFSTILGGGMSSRLFQEVREKRGLCYAVQPANASYSDCGSYSIYSGAAAEKGEELIAVICEELCKMTDTIADEELDRARTQLKSGLMMDKESTMQRAEELCRHHLLHGRHISAEEQLEHFLAVSKQDVNAIAAQLLASTPTLAVLGNISHVPAYEKIQRWLA